MIKSPAIVLVERVVINVSKNVISYLFIGYNLQTVNYHFPICHFQFFGSQKNITNKIFRIIIDNTNLVSKIFNQDAENVNCQMLQSSLFNKQNPLQVYRHFIFSIILQTYYTTF